MKLINIMCNAYKNLNVRAIILSLLLTLTAVTANAAEKLYVYNWTEYVPTSLINKFTKETGIEVIYSTFESNEEMYSKLKLMKGAGYDVVFPSSYYIKKLAQADMLQPLDLNKLPNAKHITPALLNQDYDPNNKYSLPYIYGLTGLAVNKAVIDPAKVTSWADLWNPEFKGELLLMNDSREVFHIALLQLGYSPNTTDPKEIEAAYELLRKLIPNVQAFNSDSPDVPYVQEEVNVGMIWNGSAYRATEEHPDLEFIYPKEGAILWVDCFAIPSQARNIDAAYKFMDFLLEPENAKQILESTGFSIPNDGIKAMLNVNEASNPILFPPASELEKSILQQDVGEAIDIYENFWNKLRTTNR